MTAPPLWQTATFAICAGLVVALELLMVPSLALQLALLAPLVAILGLPHGGLDLPIAEALWPLRGLSGRLKFFLVYSGLVLAVIAFWLWVPGVALAAFLAYSVLHFSGDWSNEEAPLRWTGGIATIGAPALFHTREVEALFAYLAPAQAAALCVDVAAFAGGLALGAFILLILLRRQARNRAALEQAIIWSAGFLLPPLLFFVVYFCGLHSIRHLDAAIKHIPHARRALLVAATLSALTTLAAAVFMSMRGMTVLETGVPAQMQAIFIGLSALTVPHMLLAERFQHRRS